MDSSEREQLLHWFLPQLEEAWDEEAPGGTQVLGQRYVQWNGLGLGLQIECSSNIYLTGSDRLLATHVAKLRKLGWHDPVGDDLLNHWQVFLNREDLVDAAAALASAVEVLEVASHTPIIKPVPTPTPKGGPHPVTAAVPGRTVVVVPVERVDGEQVGAACRSVQDALGPCVLLDLFASPADPPRGVSTRPFNEIVADPRPLTGPVIAQLGFQWKPGPLHHDMREVSRILHRVEVVRRSGHDCLLVLPSLSYAHRWLYGAALDLADVVVFALHDEEDGHQSWGVLRDVVPILDQPLAVMGVARRLEGSVRRAVGGLTALVETWDHELQSEALSILIQQVWDRDAPVWDRDAPGRWPGPATRQVLLHAQIAPLVCRLERLGRRQLQCTHHVKEALDLLGALITAVQDHLEHVQEVGFRSLGDVLPLFDLLADAGARRVEGVELAAPALRWLGDCGAEDAEPILFAYEQITTPRAGADPPPPNRGLSR